MSISPRPLEDRTSRIDLRLIKPRPKRSAASQFRRIVIICEALADFVTVTLAVTSGYLLYNSLEIGKHIHYPARTVGAVAIGFAMIMTLMLDRVGAYRQGNSLLRVRETEQVLRVSTQAFLIVFAVSFFTSILFSRWLLFFCLGLVPLLLFVQKILIYLLVRSLHSRGYGNEKVLIYGSGSTGRRVFSVLSRSPKLGLVPIAFVDDDLTKVGSNVFEMGYDPRRAAPVIPGPMDKKLIAEYGADLVIIAIPSLARAEFTRTVEEVLGANARVSFVPNHLLPSDPWVAYQDFDGVLLASFGRPVPRLAYEAAKRLCDLLGSLFFLLSGAPVFLLLAFLIKVNSKGPVLFRQERVGQNGRLFRMYKFRTMQTTASPYSYSPLTLEDERITGIGRFLRRTSLDELPQLLNVLEGSMSLVGPRPEMPFIVDQYTDKQRQRLEVKPGITGLWQLSGDRAFLIHKNIEYDLYYIEHRNFFMDLSILLHTSFYAMRGI